MSDIFSLYFVHQVSKKRGMEREDLLGGSDGGGDGGGGIWDSIQR